MQENIQEQSGSRLWLGLDHLALHMPFLDQEPIWKGIDL